MRPKMTLNFAWHYGNSLYEIKFHADKPKSSINFSTVAFFSIKCDHMLLLDFTTEENNYSSQEYESTILEASNKNL